MIAVIINHFNKDLLPSGYLGVDIFFVISGYVITSSLADRQSKNFLDFVTGFYERRIKRLVPALAAFVLITSVLICLVNPDTQGSLETGTLSLIGLSNISLFNSSTNYFAASSELNPFTHTWSLGVEEQFYLLFPFLIWFSGFGQQRTRGARNLFLGVGALTIASLISFIHLHQVNQPAAYFLMPPRFWEMAAGCLIFIGFQRRAKIEQALEQVPPLLVTAAMFSVMLLPTGKAVPATISMVALSAVLIACLKRGTAAYDFFTLEKVVYLGTISYSLYLWHWGILSVSRWTIGVHLWSAPIQIGLMLLMATGSYKWIETPIRSNALFRGSKGGAVAFSLTLPAIGAALITVAAKTGINNYLYIGDRKISDQLVELGSTEKTLYKNSGWSIQKCVLTGRQDISKSLLDLDDCYLKYDIKTKKGKRKILVVGNSFSVAQMRMYESLSANGEKVYLTSGWGCPIVKTMKTQNAWKESCDHYNETIVPKMVAKLSAGDALIMVSDASTFAPESNRQLSGFDQQDKEIQINGRPSSSNERFRELSKELDSLITRLDKKGIAVAIQDMTPLTRALPDPTSCINPLGFSPKDICSFYQKSRHENARKRFSQLLRELSRTHSNLKILDLFDMLCPKHKCDYTDQEGNLLYRDSAHLSDFASHKASKTLMSLITTANE